MDEDQKFSVLVGILDPETRKHTVTKQGADTSYMVLRNEVMHFVNSVIGVKDGDPMQIGAFADSSEDGAQSEYGSPCEHQHIDQSPAA